MIWNAGDSLCFLSMVLSVGTFVMGLAVLLSPKEDEEKVASGIVMNNVGSETKEGEGDGESVSKEQCGNSPMSV